MYNDEDTSDGSESYTENDDIEHFVNRCSICFDAQLDFCLQPCKDQFCLPCFRKYVVEVVKLSWGLEMTQIKCPVCTIAIPKYEWSRYVPRTVIEMYDEFNTPYRSYCRSCPHCETDIIPCKHDSVKKSGLTVAHLSRSLCKRMQCLLSTCPISALHFEHRDHMNIRKWISVFDKFEWTEVELPTLHREIITDLFRFQLNHLGIDNLPSAISLQILGLCSRSDIWKDLQFSHISLFPDMACPHCELSICLYCGNTSHVNLTCEQNFERIINDKATKQEVRDTLKWHLSNSRRCPKCSVMINRDEGCNKVDCSYCGFAFCWACRASWTDGCGFYRCSNSSVNTVAEDSNTESEEKALDVDEDSNRTELGVPNVKSIQAKFKRGY